MWRQGLLPAIHAARIMHLRKDRPRLALCLTRHGCRNFIQSKTNQDLPKENMDSALEELVATYKTELGLTEKEADQLEHLQVSTSWKTVLLCVLTQQLCSVVVPANTAQERYTASAYRGFHRFP